MRAVAPKRQRMIEGLERVDQHKKERRGEETKLVHLPPGGCTVPVYCMTTRATAMERDPASQRRFSKLGDNWNKAVMQTPITALMIWPKKALRGWLSGDSIEPYNKTAEAPYNASVSIQQSKLIIQVGLGWVGLG
jgi:hypothetical protein